MKKLLVLTSALLICGASLASAAAPGCNLTWVNCSTLAAAGNYTFTCDDNGLTRNMVASYRLAAPTADFVGISAVIDVAVGDAGLPAWFQFASGGCREGSFAPVSVGSATGCTNAYTGTAGQAGGAVIEAGPAPNKFRIRADWARAEASAQVANTLYSALVMQMNTAQTWDEGVELPFCAGCSTPACFVLNSLQIFSLSQGMVADLGNADFRNWATYQGGGFGAGCPGETPSMAATWGAVKALYR